MYNKNRKPNFNANPYIEMSDIISTGGYEDIVRVLKNSIAKLNKEKKVIVIDCFHGIDQSELYEQLVLKLSPDHVINSEEARLTEEETFRKFEKFIVPEDRTYGVYAVGTVDEFFDEQKVTELRERVGKASGLVVIYGVAASLIDKGDMFIYGNLTYEAIKERYARGMDNWGAGNYEEEQLRKEKRGSFVEWPILNKHKVKVILDAEYVIDFSKAGHPVMITGEEAKEVVLRTSKRPFQLVPVFLKAVWGGHWMQKVLGVCQDWENAGWGMTGHILLQFVDFKLGGNDFLFNAQDMLYYEPKKILGESIYYQWGYRCPVTVNFLDTWDGGNLSLQVHPPCSYGQDYLNAPRGHHESYYMFDTTDHSSVYLGLKEGTKVKEMVEDLKKSNETGEKFDDEKYINRIPMKKHQHVFIPSGTVHSSGEGTVVLEIDQYTCATFKLWDWGRVDLNGVPRPININHGQYCIQEDFQGDFVYDRFIAKQPEVDRGDGWRQEDSSSINFEPMSVQRYWFSKNLHLECKDAVQIIVIMEGEEALIESVDGSFEPFVAHYAEATYIPAAVGQFTIKPYGRSENDEIGIVAVSYPV